jgi:hypothetical protein
MLRDDSGNGGGGRRPSRNVLGDRLDLCSLNSRAWIKIKNLAHPAIERAMLIALSKQARRT